ncbi:MAG: DUF4184 family protein, partial [Cytophagales bacterium]|nr:DUF4184 family protein [Cytophagales bacterium]
MPFTFSHPALVLPLRRLPRRWVSVTGLVVGSVAPDFEKYLKMNDGNAYSHSLTGMFFFDLPVALGLAFLFHAVVRNPLIDHLPPFFRWRLDRYKAFHWPGQLSRYGAVLAGSVLAGIASHLGWDAFTHRDGAAVAALPFLRTNVS